MPPGDPPTDAPSIRTRVTIERHGKTATGFELPAEAVTALGAGKRPPICVTLRGHTYRTSVGSRGGRFLVGVSAEQRAASGVHAGEEVDVVVELDTAARDVVVPDDLDAALAAVPTARMAFDGLSFSQKRRHVDDVAGAKTAETRVRRIARTVEALTPRAPVTRFEAIGADIGARVSVIAVDAAPGTGPRLHRHPYEEVFVVLEGEATFTLGDTHQVARAGDVVVAPAGVPHGFTNTGSTPVRQVNVHVSPRFETEWLA